MQLNDKVAIVTGAASGFGAEIARQYVARGARVMVADRNGDGAKTVAAALGDAAVAVTCDVTVEADIRTLVDGALARFGKLDVVVPNAAAYENTPLADLTDEQWRRLQSVNVDGLFYVLQATVPHLKASRGNVVAISSVSGMRGDWGQFAYNATKGAGVTMLQSLALDLGPDGVRVNLVAPALTVTRITEGVTRTPGFEDAIRSRVALGRPGQPEDVARAVLFLASPDAAYITGALLPVDGGTTAATGQIH